MKLKIKQFLEIIALKDETASAKIRVLNYILAFAILFSFWVAGQAVRNPDRSAYASILQIARLPIWLTMATNNNNNCNSLTQRQIKMYKHIDFDYSDALVRNRFFRQMTTGSSRIQTNDGLSDKGFSDVIVCATMELYSESITVVGENNDGLDVITTVAERLSALALMPTTPSDVHKSLIVDSISGAQGFAENPGNKRLVFSEPADWVTLAHEVGHNLELSHITDSDYHDFIMYEHAELDQRFMRQIEKGAWEE
jgi:hypothetical protein